MKYTLVSIVGTGMYKSEKNVDGYIETEYHFGNKSFKTRLFMQSILDCKYRDIDQVILVGTKTSSWDCLVDKDNDDRDETSELWVNLFEECENIENSKNILGISDENIKRLEKYLSERFGIPFIIRTHTPFIDNDSVQELFACYTTVIKDVKRENNIIYDMTHGFRSMPVLLYQTLQYAISQESSRKVEIVYGELDFSNKKHGYVKDLSMYWEISEFTNALKIYNSKLDGYKLAELISPYWVQGSKALKKLTDVVQTNFSFQIVDVLKQISNAIVDYPENIPDWISSVREELKKLLNIYNPESVSKTLFNYSKLLKKKNLNTQAVITLQTSVEASIVEQYGNVDTDYGDYDWWQENGKKYLQKIKNKNYKEISISIGDLEYFRNQIAHGGGKNKKGVYPSAANIKNIYEKSVEGVENLLKKLDE